MVCSFWIMYVCGIIPLRYTDILGNSLWFPDGLGFGHIGNSSGCPGTDHSAVVLVVGAAATAVLAARSWRHSNRLRNCSCSPVPAPRRA
jgi:hypothetical protein